jgi:hypothetical protein
MGPAVCNDALHPNMCARGNDALQGGNGADTMTGGRRHLCVQFRVGLAVGHLRACRSHHRLQRRGGQVRLSHLGPLSGRGHCQFGQRYRRPPSSERPARRDFPVAGANNDSSCEAGSDFVIDPPATSPISARGIYLIARILSRGHRRRLATARPRGEGKNVPQQLPPTHDMYLSHPGPCPTINHC